MNTKKFLIVVPGFIMVLLTSSFIHQRNQTVKEPIETINAPFEMPQLTRPEFPDRTFDISDYGAVGDSITLNTEAFSRTINACYKAGGGMVIVPAGIWLTGPIELLSNVNLHLEKSAEIRFIINKQHYFPDSTSRANGDLSNPLPLIYANNCTNIAITGSGTLNGQGIGWWPFHPQFWSSHKEYYAKEVLNKAWEGLPEGSRTGRPSMIHPENCKNVLLEGISVIDGPNWMIHPLLCENVIIRRVKVMADSKTPNPDTPNTDGINPESCKNVLIEHCYLNTGDDSFAIKSGKNEEGRRRGIPCENVVIRHCEAKRLAIGSEMSGGVRNIFVDDCVLTGGGSSIIHIKTQRGRGGIVENVWMHNIMAGEVKGWVIRINMKYYSEGGVPEPVSERTPKFRNFHFKNIQKKDTNGAIAILVRGISEMPIEGVSFENISLASKGGVVCSNAHGIEFRNIYLNLQEGPVTKLKDCRDVIFTGLDFPRGIKPLMIIEGEQSANIRMDKELSQYKNDIVLKNGANENALEYID